MADRHDGRDTGANAAKDEAGRHRMAQGPMLMALLISSEAADRPEVLMVTLG